MNRNCSEYQVIETGENIITMNNYNDSHGLSRTYPNKESRRILVVENKLLNKNTISII